MKKNEIVYLFDRKNKRFLALRINIEVIIKKSYIKLIWSYVDYRHNWHNDWAF